jgi:integrase
VSEIAALDMADVDREARILVVRCGKGGRDDVVPLADELAAVLPASGPAVSYATGAAVSDAIRRVYRRAGVKARRPHDLRASFGTAAARRAQGNMRLVQRLMRHASVTSTERYVQWNPDGGEVVNGLHDAA